MYLLSYLLEEYLRDKDSLNCRRNLLYLKELVKDLPVQDPACPEDVSSVRDTFERLMQEYGLLERYGYKEINRDLLIQLP